MWLIKTFLFLFSCTPIFTQSFLETFDIDPTAPTPFYGNENWAVFIHLRDVDVQYNPKNSIADHGPNCEPPLRMSATDTYDTTHTINRYEDMVYFCKNHLMTNLRADGYGLINLMPNQLVDFSNETAVIKWDVSTFNQSAQNRDWFTVAIMPLEDLNPIHAPDWAPDLEGFAKNMIRLETTWNNGRGFSLEITNQNYDKIEMPISSYKALEDLITPSKMTRSTFELLISKNHLKFGLKLPENHPSGEDYHWWINTDVDIDGNPIQFNWTKGAVLFGHYSYNPRKDGGQENTWHWDNISIHPSEPFKIIATDKRYADEENPVLTFVQDIAANSQLIFAATDYQRASDQIELSYDEGQTWKKATRVMGSETDLSNTWGTSFVSYKIDIPPGSKSVTFRGTKVGDQNWMVRDVYAISDQNLNTSTLEFSNPDLAIVYPNPIKDQVQIQWNAERAFVKVDLYNALGQQIAELYHGNMNQGETKQFELSNFPDGQYFLKLNNEKISRAYSVMKF